MMRRWLYPALILLFSATGLAAVAVGFYMPQIRDAMVFEPARRNVEDAVRRIAEGQRVALTKTGKFVPLSAANTAPGSAALGLDWTSLSGQGFQFDAALQPSRQLRVRALPQPDAVSALRVPAQMYVVDLSPKGEFVRGAWLP